MIGENRDIYYYVKWKKYLTRLEYDFDKIALNLERHAISYIKNLSTLKWLSAVPKCIGCFCEISDCILYTDLELLRKECNGTRKRPHICSHLKFKYSNLDTQRCVLCMTLFVLICQQQSSLTVQEF